MFICAHLVSFVDLTHAPSGVSVTEISVRVVLQRCLAVRGLNLTQIQLPPPARMADKFDHVVRGGEPSTRTKEIQIVLKRVRHP